MTSISKADHEAIRRFAARVRSRGSQAVAPAQRAEAHAIVLRGHLAAARSARLAGQGETARRHLAWVTRLSAGE